MVKREQLSQSKVVTDGKRKNVGLRSERTLQFIIVVRVIKAAQGDIQRTKKGSKLWTESDLVRIMRYECNNCALAVASTTHYKSFNLYYILID